MTLYSFVLLRAINVFLICLQAHHISIFIKQREKKTMRANEGRANNWKADTITNQKKIIALDWKTYDKKCSIFQFLDKTEKRRKKIHIHTRV